MVKPRDFINKILLRNSHYEVIKRDPLKSKYKDHDLSLNLEFVVTHQLLNAKDFFFIQIGANVGNDLLHQLVKKYKLEGIVVEPLGDLYEKLVHNYIDEPQVKCANVALHPTKKEADLYRIDSSQLETQPDWAIGIASFKKEIFEKHRKSINSFATASKKEKVSCITLMELTSQYDVGRLDLLQIDTEGFDYEIIKMIDFNILKPNIIRYEYKHLTRRENDKLVVIT